MPEKLDLKNLTKKLCALLMLTTAQRVQTLHVFKLSCVEMNSAGCTIKIVDKLKHTRQGNHQQDLELSKFPDRKLCVIKCLNEYILTTKHLRKGEDRLLLCYAKPHGPASKDSIARWLKAILQDAGIKEFTAHSFRSVASSAMAMAGVSIQDIMKKAGWTNAGTFYKFYYKKDQSVSVRGQNKNSDKNTILKYFDNSKK